MDIREELFKNQDLKYREFSKKLIPNIDGNLIIGVRVPQLRKIAKIAYKENCPNSCEYYEEKLIQGFVYALKKCSIDEHMDDIRSFVPLIDNWAVCDLCSFKFINDDLQAYYPLILSFIDGGEFTTRFAVVNLMNHYLLDDYIDDVLTVITSIKSNHYYVNMAIAWAISVAFVKYREMVIDILEKNILSPDVQNETIQKIRDSLRVSKEDKELVKQYKIKKQ